MSNNYSAKSVKLILRTSDADNDAGDMFGTWKNVDIPNILGHMIDEFTEFNICLQSVAQFNSSGVVGTNAYDLFVQLALTGPNFVNQAYNYNARSHNNMCIFSPFTLKPDAFTQTTFLDYGCTFNSIMLQI